MGQFATAMGWQEEEMFQLAEVPTIAPPTAGTASRPWHTDRRLPHDSFTTLTLDASMELLARTFSFLPRDSHPSRKWRAISRLRLMNRVWDCAFGRYLERFAIAELAVEGAAVQSVRHPIGAVASRSAIWRVAGDVSVPPNFLKYLTLQVENQGLSEGFMRGMRLRAVGASRQLCGEYTTMRRLRQLRGIHSFQAALLPRAPLSRFAGRSIALAFPWLRSLSLYGSTATDADMQEIWGFPSLEELDLSWCRELDRFDWLLHFPEVTVLNLLATNVDITALHKYVLNLVWLQTLNLTNCHKLARSDFSRVLRELPRLDELLLCGVPAPTCTTLPAGRELSLAIDLGHCQLEDDTLTGWSVAPLRSLSVEYCTKLTSKGLQTLSSQASTLVALNLRQNGHLPPESVAFVSALRRLKILSFARCPRLSDLSMQLISDLSCVEELDLEFTDVTDRGMSHLERWMTLRCLSLVGVRISGESMTLLATFVQRGLRHLDVSACNLLPSYAVIFLRELPGVLLRC